MGPKIPGMVTTSKNTISNKLANRKKIQYAVSLAVLCIIIPFLVIYIDPIFILAKYKLRIANGSILHEFLQKEVEASRLMVYVYNVSNAERFLSGEDEKMSVQEVGPFIYQEYRTNEDIHFDTEAGVVRFIPRFRAKFVEEGSFGRPEDTILVTPYIPYLSATSFFSTYPYMIRSVYSMWVKQHAPKPIRTINVHSYLWGYRDKILDLCNTLVPGLVYYKTIGILDRLYDYDADYIMDMDITDSKKFQVRSVLRTRRKKTWNVSDLVDTKLEFKDTYEGAAFPPELTPQTKLNFYRPGICKTLAMEYSGTTPMKLGPEAFVYRLSNDTFTNKRLCNSKGLCPQGVIDLSSCFYGLPIAVTKTHFLDVDPAFADRIEGIHANRDEDNNYLVVEPKIGLTVETSLSLQLNLLLGDISYMSDLAKFKDLMLPIAHVKMTLPELPLATKNSLKLLYVTGPQILRGLEIVSWGLGLILIVYSLKLASYEWFTQRRTLRRKDNKLKGKVSAELPLIS